MGLFVKKFDTGNSMPLYHNSIEKTRVIVGLGNPGGEYAMTRHNAGYMAIDAFAIEYGFPAWQIKRDLKCQLTKTTMLGVRVILIKPTTFMNKSGEAVQAVQQFFKVHNEATIVVHDELDIAFGEQKTKHGGGSAGHNGIKSLIAYIGNDFTRIRIGIGPKHPPQIDGADFVLAPFTTIELAALPEALQNTAQLLNSLVSGNEQPNQ